MQSIIVTLSILLVASLGMSGITQSHAFMDYWDLSPREQIDGGILPENVVCNDGLQLMLKVSGDGAICVMESSVAKFTERDIATVTIEQLTVDQAMEMIMMMIQDTDDTMNGDDAVVTDDTMNGDDAVVTDDTMNGDDAVVTDDTMNGDDAVVTDDTMNGDDVVVTDDTMNGDDAVVTDDTMNGDDAVVTDDTMNGDDAVVTDDTMNGDDAVVTDDTMNGDDAVVTDDTMNGDDAVVTDDTMNGDDAVVTDDTMNGDDAVVTDDGMLYNDDETVSDYTTDKKMMHMTIDTNALKSEAMSIVAESVDLYDANGDTSFDMINDGSASYQKGDLYPFVLDTTEFTIVAHGVNPELIGGVSVAMTDSDRSSEMIIADMEVSDDNGTWVMYRFNNPDTDMEQTKKSWMVLHDGYIFGSGFYLTDLEANKMVAKYKTSHAIALYDEMGVDAFQVIRDSAADRKPGDLYPFVVNAENMITVARGANPDFSGIVADALFDADRPIESIMNDMETNDGTWTMYTFNNPDTDMEQTKKSWIVLHDGYIFGSGFYLTDLEANKMVAKYKTSRAITLYDEMGVDAFQVITDSAADRKPGDLYPFVVNTTDVEIVAHGADPERVGDIADALLDADRSFETIVTDMEAADNNGTWARYSFYNPDTEMDEAKKSWMVLHDGYIFGSGFYDLPTDEAEHTGESEAEHIWDTEDGIDAWTGAEHTGESEAEHTGE